MILKVDMAQKRISLGLRQTQPDPWSSLPDRYPPGTEITGPITGLTEFGVFMEIEEGIEGLIHISELAHERIDDVSEHFKRGDEVTAVILNIDPIEQRASLSRKRLLPYSASEGGDADYSQSSAQGGRPGQGGGRKGRRGGRRSSEIDYDYSYAASESGNKTTTKLGDVYADLFAQFGLATEKDKAAQERIEEAAASNSAGAQETGSEATASAPQEAQPETAGLEGAEAEVTGLEARVDAPEASPGATEASAEATAEGSAEDPAEDSENAIDAAEAAAMLTAAFRQGRRPAAESSEPEGEEDGETSPEERVEERSNA
jgi:small subunit ribosomal protein S1